MLLCGCIAAAGIPDLAFSCLVVPGLCCPQPPEASGLASSLALGLSGDLDNLRAGMESFKNCCAREAARSQRKDVQSIAE